MNRITDEILNEIKSADRIIISRHVRPDGDAVGSSQGLKRILQLTYPEKEILLINDDLSDYLSFVGEEDNQIHADEYKDALVIVLDTATNERVSNKKYKHGKKVIKIDHHIETEPYGDICWIEEKKSSCSEMITSFWLEYRDELKIDNYAATCLYMGIVTDSGRFRYNSTDGDTLRCSAELLDIGIDTDRLFAQLYLEDYDYFKFRAYAFSKVKTTEHGVAYIYIDQKMQKKFGLTREEASQCVSLMDSLKGCIVWIAFIQNDDKTIRVRLRSRFATVNKLAEKYSGGGHACASGATAHNKKEMKALLADADELIKDYKENNEGWL